MKKTFLLTALIAVIAALTLLTGCNAMINDTSADTIDVSSDVSESSGSSDKGFEKFVKYMEDGGYIKGKSEKLSAAVIGAEYGDRYTISSGTSKIYVELYEYKDTESDIARSILGAAKEKGTFALYNEIQTDKTAAAVSADGKYLMLYTDSSTSGNSVQTKNDALAAVEKYGKNKN